MAGEGFMMNAIQSLKFNKAQRRSQKLDWKDYVGQEKVPGRDPIKATPELLEEIRIRIQTENRKRKKRQILFALLSFLIALSVFLIIVFY